jgi:hypothetical protein
MTFPCHAALVRYAFHGIAPVPAEGVDFYLEPGTVYGGGWTVDTEHVIESRYHQSANGDEGWTKQYKLVNGFIRIDSSVVDTDYGVVSISHRTSVGDVEVWPSGNYSDYVVRLLWNDPGIVDIAHFGFSHEGGDYWGSDLDAPLNASFFEDFTAFRVFSAAGIYLPITNLSAVIVPAPFAGGLFASAVAGMCYLFQRRM